jgi:hypothetical protein
MKSPIQAKPVERALHCAERTDRGLTQSDCCGAGKCCVGGCIPFLNTCAGVCVPNIGQC